MDFVNKFTQGNSRDTLKLIADKSVRCCVTSPPHFALRDYGTGKWEGGYEMCKHEGPPQRTKANVNKNCGTGNDIKNGEAKEFYKSVCKICGAVRIDEQIGLEETPEQYVAALVEVFEEVKRILADDGTLWLNLGDSYAATSKNRTEEQVSRKSTLAGSKETQLSCSRQQNKIVGDLKPKDLIGIPWMVAFALRAAGWYLRQDIIWHKPNPMPESVMDRCTKAHEYIFLLSKSRQYYYDADAIKTPIANASVQRLLQAVENQEGSSRVPGKTNGRIKAVDHKNLLRQDKNHSFHEARKGIDVDNSAATKGSGTKGHSGNYRPDGSLIGDGMANKKSVWTIVTQPYSEAHFAAFPPALIVDCIKAGSAEGDIILDPFSGAGTTAMVAQKLNRNFIAIELNPKYIEIAERRLDKELGMFRKR